MQKPVQWRSVVVSGAVSLLAALSPMLFARVKTTLPQPVVAIASGLVVGIMSLVALSLFQEAMPLAKAVLLGVLVAEVMLFHASTTLSMTTVLLFMFLYWNATEKASGSH